MADRVRVSGVRPREGLAPRGWSDHVRWVRRPHLGDRGHNL